MTTRRGTAMGVAVMLVASAGACGGGKGTVDGGEAGRVGADAGGAGSGGMGDCADADAAFVEGGGDVLDVATDFGVPEAPEVAIHCPLTTADLSAPAADVLIDDFAGAGKLDGRSREGNGFSVREQFDSTDTASFTPAPAVEVTCGAAAAGAAHVRGAAADTGATFAMIFSSPAGDGGKPANRYDASARKGLTFRVALGDPKAAKLVTVQVNVADSQWDYSKDVIVSGTTWQQVTIPWSDLQAAPAAPAFAPAGLNQIVFPFSPNGVVDVYIDDVAFLP